MDSHATDTGIHDESILFSMTVANFDFRILLFEFLKSEFSADNLEFYLAVQELREMLHGELELTKLISEQILKSLNVLLTTFVLVGADMEINIGQKLRKKILRLRGKIFSPISIIFNRSEIMVTLQEAQREVQTIMGGCLARFTSSLIFDQYVSQSQVLSLSSALRSISLKQSSILVIESDDATGKLVCKKLRDLTQCDTTLVRTVHDADSALASNIFVAIVINIDLDRENETAEARIERLHNAAKSSMTERSTIWPVNTVVVATLNKPNAEVQAKCLRSGICAVLAKPYQISQLVDLIFPARNPSDLMELLRRVSVI